MSSSAWKRSALCRWPTRRKNSANASRPRSRAGARSCAMPASAPIRNQESVMQAIARNATLVLILLLAGVGQAQAQTGGYPDRPVRLIVPFAPAGPVDVVARLVGQKLTERFGKQFFVENQVGAGGNIGMGNAAKAAPDGHTILFVSSSYVVNPSLYARAPYDPYKDFIPVTVAGDVANTLIVHPSVPAKNVQELIELIKASPGKYNYAHAASAPRRIS